MDKIGQKEKINNMQRLPARLTMVMLAAVLLIALLLLSACGSGGNQDAENGQENLCRIVLEENPGFYTGESVIDAPEGSEVFLLFFVQQAMRSPAVIMRPIR